MAEAFNGRNRIRKKFGKIREVARMPNLIEVQKSSYDDFLMVKEPEGGRIEAGCEVGDLGLSPQIRRWRFYRNVFWDQHVLILQESDYWV